MSHKKFLNFSWETALRGKNIIGIKYLTSNHIYELTLDKTFNNTMVIEPHDFLENYALIVIATIPELWDSIPSRMELRKKINKRKSLQTAKNYYEWAFK